MVSAKAPALSATCPVYQEHIDSFSTCRNFYKKMRLRGEGQLRAGLVVRCAAITAVLILIVCTHALAGYQIQIGSTKDINGAHYFASKASKVLGQPASIIQHSGYYTVLVGKYDTRDQAMKAYLVIIKHYNALISSYENPPVLAVYVDGAEGAVDADVPAVSASPEVAAVVPAPAIRQVKETELALLKKRLEKGLANVAFDGCLLKNQETFDQYVFVSSCKLATLNPNSVTWEERHGRPYIKAEFLAKGEGVRTEGRVGDKSAFTGAEQTLLLRSALRGREDIKSTVKAFRELIQHCAKEKK